MFFLLLEWFLTDFCWRSIYEFVWKNDELFPNPGNNHTIGPGPTLHYGVQCCWRIDSESSYNLSDNSRNPKLTKDFRGTTSLNGLLPTSRSRETAKRAEKHRQHIELEWKSHSKYCWDWRDHAARYSKNTTSSIGSNSSWPNRIGQKQENQLGVKFFPDWKCNIGEVYLPYLFRFWHFQEWHFQKCHFQKKKNFFYWFSGWIRQF